MQLPSTGNLEARRFDFSNGNARLRRWRPVLTIIGTKEYRWRHGGLARAHRTDGLFLAGRFNRSGRHREHFWRFPDQVISKLSRVFRGYRRCRAGDSTRQAPIVFLDGEGRLRAATGFLYRSGRTVASLLFFHHDSYLLRQQQSPPPSGKTSSPVHRRS